MISPFLDGLLVPVVRGIKHLLVGIATAVAFMCLVSGGVQAVEFIGRHHNLGIFISAVIITLALMWVGKGICHIIDEA
jgi:hypothetical protein